MARRAVSRAGSVNKGGAAFRKGGVWDALREGERRF
jgi:hypothetical protein